MIFSQHIPLEYLQECHKYHDEWLTELEPDKVLIIDVDAHHGNGNAYSFKDNQNVHLLDVYNADIYPTSDFRASTEIDGDNNAAIYITKKIALETPATSLRVVFAANKLNTADIEVLFKILRSDDAFDFDEIGYTFFNTDGSPDSTVNTSLETDDFQDYTYSAGVTDDGIGDPLPEFIQFAIKIVMKGTNAAQPPRIRDLRVIALAT
mgnify:CR=1 FL=1